ncbi:hypothetical protein GCM10009555_038170 [Acrocarpospora macrocephala]|uniref:Uncharacterized protein n=1 Tax=Acrocarpospora macrocephala TaxID=150177 RepID=A0A5M3WSL8_9ACTN|nr:hypothetical protein Amac_032990 [Acrocarpospora macrocephala]
MRGQHIPPQLGRRLPPIHPRHHHIQRDDIRIHLPHPIKTILPIGRRVHIEALQGQIDRDELPNDLIVIHYEYAPQNLTHGREANPSQGYHARFSPYVYAPTATPSTIMVTSAPRLLVI